MTALRKSVVERTMKQVEIVYLSRDTAKWWNARRRPDDTATFCGWYWIHRREEMGPFKSRSACIRDAYYRLVLQRELPSVGQSQLHGAERAARVVKLRRKVA
jgi:hypothetical protein